MNRILVTGASGLIGSAFCRKFSDEFELLPASRNSAIALDLLGGDEVIRSEIERLRPDVILHLAAHTDVSSAYDQKGDRSSPCYRLNVEATESIARAAKETGAYLVSVSTDFVFDGSSRDPLTEDCECSPIEWYGETKWIGETAVREQAGRWSIARISFPFSLQGETRPDFVTKVRDRLGSGESAFLFTDQVITPTWIEDIVDGLALLSRVRPEEEVFHLTGGGSYSPCEIGRMIAQSIPVDEELVVESSLEDYLQTDPRPRQKYLLLNNTKWRGFCSEAGLAPPRDLADLLGRLK